MQVFEFDCQNLYRLKNKPMQQTFQLVPSEDLKKLFDEIAELKQIVLQRQEPKASKLVDWISQKEAQDLLGKKYTSLFKLRKDGSLIATTTRPIFYSLESIQNYLNSNK